MHLIIVIIFVFKISALPIQDDRIIFPDDGKYTRLVENRFDRSYIENNVDDLKFSLSKLLNDSNLLKSDDETDELQEQFDENLLYGEFFQGDIDLEPEQMEFLDNSDDETLSTRTGLISTFYRWPKDTNGMVNVPYSYSNDYSPANKAAISKAMNDIEKYTCIKFIPYKNQKDYIHIESDKICSSKLGKIGGRQRVSLNKNGCLFRGTIIHELIHALGFDHMQNRAERDRHIQIIWDNVDKSKHHNFKVVDPNKFKDFNTTYDMYSVMHYGPKAFSKNGKVTIVPCKEDYKKVIGQRYRMSAGDALRLNNMYECEDKSLKETS